MFYNLSLRFSLEEKKLYVKGYIDIDTSIDGNIFFIHSHKKFKQLEFSPTIPFDIIKEELFFEDMTSAIRIDNKVVYRGRIDLDYYLEISNFPYDLGLINKDYIELSLYSLWFPFSRDRKYMKGSVRVEGLEGYYLVKEENNVIKVDNSDIPIIAFNKSISKKVSIGENITLTYMKNSKLGEFIESRIKYIINFIEEILGVNINFPFDITIVPRQEGGGFNRNNIILLDTVPITNPLSIERYLCHEISHFYLCGAPLTWEDWLNESFAHYLDLLYLGKFDMDKFQAEINAYYKMTKDIDPIKDSDRTSENGSKARYKGAYLLYLIEKKFSYKKLIGLYKSLISLEEKTTKNLIENLEDKQLADYIKEAITVIDLEVNN